MTTTGLALCEICAGRGQVTAGTACPVCGGSGVSSAADAAAWRERGIAAAVAAYEARLRQQGTADAAAQLREEAAARQAAQDAARTATLMAGKAAAHAATLADAQTVLSDARAAADALVSAAELAAIPPDPTDPPPGAPIPPGFGAGDVFYMDSLLVRQLDVWGLFTPPGGGGGGLMTNPMTTLGDMIDAAAGGVPQRLAVGANAQVLTVVGGVPAWANSASGFANPMTTSQDLIVGGAGGAAGRLGVGANGQILTVQGGTVQWFNAITGFINPMTTTGDMITGGASGVAGRLGVGAAGQVLTVVSGAPAWANNAAGFTNPMTTGGDLIRGGTGGAALRIAVGANGQVLTVVSGVPTWANSAAGFANPMTAPGDLIAGGLGGAAIRLPVGAASSILGVNSAGNPAWLGAVANVLAFGADPTGAADSTAAFNAAYNSLPITGTPGIGGVVYAPAGTYKISGTLQLNAVAPVYLKGDGPQATTLAFTAFGPSDAVSMFNNYHPGGGGSSSILVWGGGVSDLTIDGTNATPGSVGLHMGDMKYAHLERVNIQNFTGTGAIGLWQDNRKFWTEDCLFECHVLNCTNSVVIDNSGAAGGAGDVHDNNTYEISLAGVANGNGVVLQGGANCYNCRFYIHGGIPSATAGPVGYFLTVTGQDPSGNPKSQMSHCDLVMKVESDGNNNFPPGLILTSLAGNAIGDCAGHLTYQAGNGLTPSSVAGSFNFTGPINGDATLLQTPHGVPASGATVQNNNPPVLMCVSGGTVTAIKVNGGTTGFVSGAFYVPAGGTYEIDYTVAPTVNWITAVPQ
jgi:hypothetical protein